MHGSRPQLLVGQVFQTAVRRAGLKDFRFHDLRHTFASHLVTTGVSLKAVAELLGHKDIKMTLSMRICLGSTSQTR
ncbi:MAG: tyrosine-type recombinase/integrase [Candidatus Methylomirabilales bacterium]